MVNWVDTYSSLIQFVMVSPCFYVTHNQDLRGVYDTLGSSGFTLLTEVSLVSTFHPLK
jgi:hypothetical protein